MNFVKENQLLRANFPRSYQHKLKTEDIKVVVTDANGKELSVKVDIINENRLTITSTEEARGCKVEIIGTRTLGESPLIFMAENSVRLITGVKSINITYNTNDGTVLPGYKPSTKILGVQIHNSSGTRLVASGWQDTAFAYDAFNNGWLSKDSLINQPYLMNTNGKLTLKANYEPFNGLRIDITANRSISDNTSEYYIADKFGNLPTESERGKRVTGNFSMSYLSWGTAFERIYNKDKDFSSAAFDKFNNEYRQTISSRLANDYMLDHPDSVLTSDAKGYYSHFGSNSQDVLIPAFLAAYGGRDPNKVSLATIPSILQMMPNWRITFDGLSNLEFVKRFSKALVLVMHIAQHIQWVTILQTPMNYSKPSIIKEILYHSMMLLLLVLPNNSVRFSISIWIGTTV